MLLDIVVLPPANIRQKVGQAILRATRGADCKYVVDNKKLIPHVSLFHIRTSQRRLKLIEQQVKSVLGQYKATVLMSQEVDVDDSLTLWINSPQNLSISRIRLYERAHQLGWGQCLMLVSMCLLNL